MKKITKTLAAGIVAAMFLVGCAKDGATGPAGATGPQGAAGTNGTNGVANITTSTGTTTNASWVLNGSEYYATFSVSDIDATVVTNGTIMVFLGNTAQTDWVALPFAYGNQQYNYNYSVGQVQIEVSLENGSTPTNPGGLPFKIVIIPPAHKKANVNPNNYAEVKAAYNLKD